MSTANKKDDDALMIECRAMFNRLNKQERKDFIAFCEQLLADATAKPAAKAKLGQ